MHELMTKSWHAAMQTAQGGFAGSQLAVHLQHPYLAA